MRALEPQFLVVLVAILQRQGLEFAFGQVCPRREIQLQHFVTGCDAFLAQVVFERRHVAGAHAKDVQRLQLVQMHALGSVLRQCALEREALALEAHPASEQLDDLRAFTLTHVQQAHRGHAPTAPAFRELTRADQHVEAAVLVVQRAEQRAAKVVAFAVEGLDVLRHPEEARIVADVDEAEGLCIAHAQRQLTFAALDVDQFQSLAGRGIEHSPQDVDVQIIHATAEAHQGRETPAEDVVALGVQNLRLVRNQVGQPALDLHFAVQEVCEEVHHFQDVRLLA